MARSLVGGLLSNQIEPSSITISDPLQDARELLADTFQVNVTEDNDEVVARSECVILAVKPQVMQDVLQTAAGSLQHHRPLLVSIAAGITIDSINTWSGGGFAIVRVMPNTPALILQGISALYANDQVSETQRQSADSILSAVGETVWMDDESKLDAVTAVSGSGPAYLFYLIEAMQSAAEELGLDSEDAHLLATRTAVGAAMLAAQSEESPATLRKQVTSPGGTTEAALNVLESASAKNIIIRAISAARNRAVEMSKQSD